MSSAQDYQSPACSGIFQEQNEGPPTQPCLNGNVTEQKDELVNIQKNKGSGNNSTVRFTRNTHVGLTSQMKKVQQKVSLAGGSFQTQVNPFRYKYRRGAKPESTNPEEQTTQPTFASQASTKLKTGQAPKK